MASLDDAVKESVPNNDFIKPMMIAAGALILGRMFGGGGQSAPQAAPAPAPEGQQASSGGGLLGTLGGILCGLVAGGAAGSAASGGALTGGLDSLLNQFRNAGHGSTVDSWVGTGQNSPISAETINSVIGQGKLAEIAKAAGVDTAQLSQILASSLPGLIDKLTPGGQLPKA
jgi:uncharacterized protein YidB (DUF937 family)